MLAVVVYESMFGNTHVVADHVASGLKSTFDEVQVVPVGEATIELVARCDLLVVGGPTHAHGMSHSQTREAAAETAATDDDLDLDPDAEGPGLRDWFDGLPKIEGQRAGAFDTRVKGPALLTGRASKGIGRRLERHGYSLVLEPESFLVDSDHHLMDGEETRASQWGEALSARL